MTTFKLIGVAFALTLSTAATAVAADCCPDMACCKGKADCCDKAKPGEHADHAGMSHR